MTRLAEVLEAWRFHGHGDEPIITLATPSLLALLSEANHTESATGNDDAGEGRLVKKHKRVERIAICCARARHEAPIKGIYESGRQRSFENHGAQPGFELEFDGCAARRFHDDMKRTAIVACRNIGEVNTHVRSNSKLGQGSGFANGREFRPLSPRAS